MSKPIDYAAEYDNSARVENSAQLINKFISDAAHFRELNGKRAQMDLTYGPEDRNMMDLFWPNTTAGQERTSPIVMFIHGGYWQRMDRSVFSHMAAGLNAHDIAVAIPSYTLCPDIKIEGIINEMRRACLVLYQTHRKPLTVIGHSAGGHLAACMMATDWEEIHTDLPHDLVTSGVGISGLYDLLPLRKTPVNDAVKMDAKQAKAASPIRWVPDATHRFDAWVGGDESSEFHRQSQELAVAWSMMGTPTQYESVDGANHFSVANELVDPDSAMVRRIVDLMRDPVTPFHLEDIADDILDDVVKAFNLDAELDAENADDAVTTALVETEEIAENLEPEQPLDPHIEAEIEAEMEAEIEAQIQAEVEAEPVALESAEEQPAQPGDPDQADAAPQEKTE